MRFLFLGVAFQVREHIPLEQGLRLLRGLCVRQSYCKVREHIPLEQGLRPYYPTVGQALHA